MATAATVKKLGADLDAAAEAHRLADKVARSRADLWVTHGHGCPEGVELGWAEKEATLAKLHAAGVAYNEAVSAWRAQ